MPASAKIPVHQQKTTAVGGLDITHFHNQEEYTDLPEEHRDEYYILAVVIKGSGKMKCDMGTISIQSQSIFLMKPYQVHSADSTGHDADAYFMSIAPFLVPEFCRDIFENTTVEGQCIKLLPADMNGIIKMAEMLYNSFVADNIFKTEITTNLLNALIINAASHFLISGQKNAHNKTQSFRITQKFKELVRGHSFLHTASFFAERLHITTSHLNDCVKVTTGLSVTQFLQQTMLLEAKRNLYYTNDDVKKIAFDLGFEDHTYFSRLFKKLTNETPLGFRKRFRE
ncbi:AraC family transcriptional regulator [Pararcticibacter amylolyticus]|uniref:AraC family transcriptional regulator n=1 Tax=Pararcticibacter amylolyticus TaxID=2173175 RepID=A0A2U2PCS4_9SPHI|nr:helix-turn-helix domain-containing protein [Pararcticibacter amylolyticus]PWG79201.1 AraC family transcriptional regulator [Pararcticibacter amylolyticus]